MTKTVNVSGYTRRPPEKKPDPLPPEIDANRPRFRSKWGMKVEAADDAAPKREGMIDRFMPWFRRRK